MNVSIWGVFIFAVSMILYVLTNKSIFLFFTGLGVGIVIGVVVGGIFYFT